MDGIRTTLTGLKPTNRNRCLESVRLLEIKCVNNQEGFFALRSTLGHFPINSNQIQGRDSKQITISQETAFLYILQRRVGTNMRMPIISLIFKQEIKNFDIRWDGQVQMQ